MTEGELPDEHDPFLRGRLAYERAAQAAIDAALDVELANAAARSDEHAARTMLAAIQRWLSAIRTALGALDGLMEDAVRHGVDPRDLEPLRDERASLACGYGQTLRCCEALEREVADL